MRTGEGTIVTAIVSTLRKRGFRVATEVANFHRSADIAAIDQSNQVWIIECKVANIGQALIQTKVHKLSADKVLIGTFKRNKRNTTLSKIEQEEVGLIEVDSCGSITIVSAPSSSETWHPAREEVRERILQACES